VRGDELAEAIDLIYGAALDEGASWLDLGPRLCQLMDAQRASLALPDSVGMRRNVLMTADATEDAYSAWYHRLDPYRANAASAFASGRIPAAHRVLLGEEIVPDPVFTRSQFYADFARKTGRRYMIGGLLGLRDATPIGFHREAAAGPFDEDDRRTLLALLPHLQRALQLRERLVCDSAQLGAAALDAVPFAVIIVDGSMRVLHGNHAAVRLASAARSGLTIARTGPQPGIGELHLVARHRDDHALLCQLVAATASGRTGGALRIRTQQGDAATTASIAVLVSPALSSRVARAPPDEPRRVMPGAAMIVARDLAALSVPSLKLMSDLYGLTRAEAEVAVALAGAATAEDVARARRVSLETVRSQVRSILGKTNAASLRDLERLLALDSDLQPLQ
jgi:DNA-binding NarL/FixJ family response regulator